MSRASDRYQRQLLELLKLPGNQNCADCHAINPRWAAFNHGVFICASPCAGIHRKMGTHVSKVKSVSLDVWNAQQVAGMIGNTRSNAILNPDENRNPAPIGFDDSERNSQLESFIRNKYEKRKFVVLDSTSRPEPVADPTRSEQPQRKPTPAVRSASLSSLAPPSVAPPAPRKVTEVPTPTPRPRAATTLNAVSQTRLNDSIWGDMESLSLHPPMPSAPISLTHSYSWTQAPLQPAPALVSPMYQTPFQVTSPFSLQPQYIATNPFGYFQPMQSQVTHPQQWAATNPYHQFSPPY